MENINIENLTTDFYEQAVEMIKNYDMQPQYNLTDVELVDTILNYLHEDFLESGNSEGLDGISMFFSVYIIQMLINKYGGKIEFSYESVDNFQKKFIYEVDNFTVPVYFWMVNGLKCGEKIKLKLDDLTKNLEKS